MLIFLDFDGVMHPFFPRADASDEENAHFSNAPALGRVLVDYPEVKVVITSSWRTKYSLDEMRMFLGPVVGSRVIGATPISDSPHSVHARAKEIESYLASSSNPSQPWVALDDMLDLFFDHSPVILCPDEFGEVQAQSLRNFLDDPKSKIQRPKSPGVTTPSGFWLPSIK